jgi:phage repressor protein C with HTH and peptisase S24 domain
MNNRANTDEWVRLVYRDWLRNSYCKTYLRPSTRIFVEKMRDAVRVSDYEKAWVLLERLKKVSENYQADKITLRDEFHYEKPEILLECAITAYWLQDLNEAQILIRQAIGNFEDRSLIKSFSLWLQGCMVWRLPSRVEDAVFLWEHSLQTLEFADYDLVRSPAKEWIEKRKKDMREAVRLAALRGSPPSPREVLKRISRGSNKEAGTLFTIPVLGEIPAGYPRNNLPITDAQLGFAKVNLDNLNYQIFSLTEDKAVRLNSQYEYYALKVIGDSMNNSTPTKIENGNYVILRKQVGVEDGDIVAAEIINVDSRATLKRYSRDGRKHVLKSESSTLDVIFDEFDRFDNVVIIRGVVVAVLKPGGCKISCVNGLS